MPAKTLVPAAEYVRMSTDHQQYSIKSQQERIRQYASESGLEIVQTYSDAGRSGLTLRERPGLAQLLADIGSGRANFKTVCVYDVSRWGRFQDSDEAAYYEYLCKRAGVPIRFCAEQFANDDTSSSAILKALKRTMAGEFSRELSTKVRIAKTRFAAMGFRQGGEPGLGLRRLSVTAQGAPRRCLQPGERKSFPTDRVVLIPGPSREVQLVRSIFKTFIDARGRLGPADIARQLNDRNLKNANGRSWRRARVLEILTNPKYTGTNVYGRMHTLLHSRARRNPRQQWIQVPEAFKPIIDSATFTRVAYLLKKRAENTTEKELIRELRHTLKKKGRLCREYLRRCYGNHGNSTFFRRLSSLRQAYDLVGFKYPAHIFTRKVKVRQTELTRNRLIARILELFPTELAPFRLPAAVRRTSLLLDRKYVLHVWMAKGYVSPTGKAGWRIYPSAYERDGLTLLCALRVGTQAVQNMYLFPPLNLKCHSRCFGSRDPLLKMGVKLKQFSELCTAARKIILRDGVPVLTGDLSCFRPPTLTQQLLEGADNRPHKE